METTMTDQEREAVRIRIAIKEEEQSDMLKSKIIDSARDLVHQMELAGWKVQANYNDEMVPSTVDAPSSDPGQMQLAFSPRMTYENSNLPRISFLNKEGKEAYIPSIRFEYKYGNSYSHRRYGAISFKVLLETGGYGTGPGRVKTYSNRKNGRGLNVEQILMRLQEYADREAANEKARIEKEEKVDRREKILTSLQEKHRFRTYSGPVSANSGYAGHRGKWYDHGGIKFQMSFSATEAGEETLGKLLQLIEDNMPELFNSYREKE